MFVLKLSGIQKSTEHKYEYWYKDNPKKNIINKKRLYAVYLNCRFNQ
jgi:hypothetical protein